MQLFFGGLRGLVENNQRHEEQEAQQNGQKESCGEKTKQLQP